MAYSIDFEGPLYIKNGHPLYLAIGAPSILSAEAEDSISVGYAYSNVLKTGWKEWKSVIDMDTEVIDLKITKKVNDSTEASINIPWVRHSQGSSDLLVEQFHSFFGFPNEGKRSTRPRNKHTLIVMKDNKEFFISKPDEGFADIAIGLKKEVYSRETSVVALNAFLNLPSGSAEHALGSGETNGGVSILINHKTGQSSMLYMNGGLGFINQIRALQNLPLRNYFYGGLDLERAYSKKINFNLQLFIQESPFKADFIDGAVRIISIGGRYGFEKGSTLGFYFSEDIPVGFENPGTTDFTVRAEYQKKFN